MTHNVMFKLPALPDLELSLRLVVYSFMDHQSPTTVEFTKIADMLIDIDLKHFVESILQGEKKFGSTTLGKTVRNLLQYILPS